MDRLRVFRLGDSGWVISLRGVVDRDVAQEAAAEISRRSGQVIVDLVHAEIVEPEVLEELVHPEATFVAPPPLARVLAARPDVRVVPTLAAALS